MWCALSASDIVEPMFFSDAVTADCYHIAPQQDFLLFIQGVNVSF
jgi:hypothetical protein